VKTYIFGDFRLTTDDRRLIRSSGEEVPLTPRVFDLLLLLVETNGGILTKNEILERIWPDAVVEESNLTQNIFVLRKALDDPTQNPRFIKTVPRKGYRFIADVRVLDTSEPEAEARPVDTPTPFMRRRSRPWLLLGLVAICIVAAAALTGRVLLGSSNKPDELTYQQLTFERGTVWTARFLPQSNTVFYTANFNGGGLELYSYYLRTPDSHAMELPGTNLLSISSKGEMAILHNSTYVYQFIQRGTLARVSVDGSAPRDIAENVQEADWSPSGDELAVVRWTEAGNRLEYPIGTTLTETEGYFSYPRVSPSGDKIALFSHKFQKDNRGSVVVVDTAGKTVLSTDEWAGLEGLAWHGDEVWFTASRSGETYALFALSPDGTVRNVVRSPSNLILADTAPDGSALLSRAIQQTDVYFNTPGRPDADVSWLQLIGVADLANDGSAFLFTHFGEGSGKNYAVYLRKTDGSPAVGLGPGRALALSPDGRWAAAKLSDPESLVLLPTGAGETKTVPTAGVEHITGAGFFPEGRKIVFTANENGKPRRTFVSDIAAGTPPTPLTPEGVYGTLVSPDGSRLIVTDAEGEKAWISFNDGVERRIPGLERSEEVLRWGKDANTIYVFKPLELPIRIDKIDLRTGRRQLVREIQPANKAGVFGNVYLFTTADGTHTVYGLRRYLIDLFLAKGLH
jgi:DNA-binding winged helix-turn-helix (wHTH) protein/Tol biopolymer transport system component